MWARHGVSSVVSANRFLQVVGMEDMVVVSATWRAMLCDIRNFNRCDNKTQENTHISKVGGRKRKEVLYWITKWII